MASVKVEERWQAKRSTVSERNKYMLDNHLMSDVKFVFPNTERIIPAHKYVLAVSSPVFFVMFYGDLAESRDIIDITDCGFLRFIYCDGAELKDVACAIKVYQVADKYDVPSLAKECVEFIDGNMDPHGVLYVMPYARQFNERDLERFCWKVIDYNAEAIVSCGAFVNLTHDFLVSLLQRSSFHIGEATLFKAVDRWATKRCEEAGMTANGANKRTVLGEDMLKHFRFSLMNPKTFSDAVLPKEILTKDEVIDVFKCFSNVPVNGGVKFSVLPRKRNDGIIRSHSLRPSRHLRTSRDIHVPESTMLTFQTRRPILICGLKFLFAPLASHDCLSLSEIRVPFVQTQSLIPVFYNL